MKPDGVWSVAAENVPTTSRYSVRLRLGDHGFALIRAPKSDRLSGLGWLSGFDELMCRCGLENNGAPEFNANGSLRYGLHGRIANTPAHHVELTVDGDARLLQ